MSNQGTTKQTMLFDIVYSDVDQCYIAIPHIGKESVKEHYDRINYGTSGLIASFRIETETVVKFLSTL